MSGCRWDSLQSVTFHVNGFEAWPRHARTTTNVNLIYGKVVNSVHFAYAQLILFPKTSDT